MESKTTTVEGETANNYNHGDTLTVDMTAPGRFTTPDGETFTAPDGETFDHGETLTVDMTGGNRLMVRTAERTAPVTAPEGSDGDGDGDTPDETVSTPEETDETLTRETLAAMPWNGPDGLQALGKSLGVTVGDCDRETLTDRIVATGYLKADGETAPETADTPTPETAPAIDADRYPVTAYLKATATLTADETPDGVTRETLRGLDATPFDAAPEDLEKGAAGPHSTKVGKNFLKETGHHNTPGYKALFGECDHCGGGRNGFETHLCNDCYTAAKAVSSADGETGTPDETADETAPRDGETRIDYVSRVGPVIGYPEAGTRAEAYGLSTK